MVAVVVAAAVAVDSHVPNHQDQLRQLQDQNRPDQLHGRNLQDRSHPDRVRNLRVQNHPDRNRVHRDLSLRVQNLPDRNRVRRIQSRIRRSRVRRIQSRTRRSRVRHIRNRVRRIHIRNLDRVRIRLIRQILITADSIPVVLSTHQRAGTGVGMTKIVGTEVGIPGSSDKIQTGINGVIQSEMKPSI